MIKKLKLKNMLLCLFLIVPLIAGTAGTIYSNGFENPGQEGDTIDLVGKQMSGGFTAILEPAFDSPLQELPVDWTPVENFLLTVTWIFVGECGKVVLGQSAIDHPSDFVLFDQFADQLEGQAIPADFLATDPHPCFPYIETEGEKVLLITSAKKTNEVINYVNRVNPDTGAIEVIERYPDIPVRQNPPFGYIAADITVKLAVTVPAAQ